MRDKTNLDRFIKLHPELQVVRNDRFDVPTGLWRRGGGELIEIKKMNLFHVSNAMRKMLHELGRTKCSNHAKFAELRHRRKVIKASMAFQVVIDG